MEKREIVIRFRVNEEEAGQLAGKMEKAGCRTMSEFMRRELFAEGALRSDEEIEGLLSAALLRFSDELDRLEKEVREGESDTMALLADIEALRGEQTRLHNLLVRISASG